MKARKFQIGKRPENNQETTMAFQKGVSGNPGGRPKENNEVKAAAREYTIEAIERLAFWLKSDNAKASVAAATSLLDRGWGKPHQTSDVTVRSAIAKDLADDDLASIATGGREGAVEAPRDPAKFN